MRETLTRLFEYFFKPEPQNRNVFLLIRNGNIIGYGFNRNNVTIFCLMKVVSGRLIYRKQTIKGCLIEQKVSSSFMGYLAQNHKLLKHK